MGNNEENWKTWKNWRFYWKMVTNEEKLNENVEQLQILMEKWRQMRKLLEGKRGKTVDLNGKMQENVEKLWMLMEKCKKTWKNCGF